MLCAFIWGQHRDICGCYMGAKRAFSRLHQKYFFCIFCETVLKLMNGVIIFELNANLRI